MGSWNGLDLQTRFSQTLGDTSTVFKARVLEWMNDIQDDISTAHRWPWLEKSGAKNLVASEEEQNLNIDAPGAPTAVLVPAGSGLTLGSTYSFRVTFFQDQDLYESEGGTVSNTLTTTAGNLAINLTAIPVSTEPLVTKRRVYASKDGGKYLRIVELADNTTTIFSFIADTTSTLQPPDHIGIRALDGNPYLSGVVDRIILPRGKDELRFLFPGDFSTGTPQWWADVEASDSKFSILLYPKPSVTDVVRFPYLRKPARIFAETTSQPTMPIELKRLFRTGVLSLGYEFRERPQAQTYMDRYEQQLELAVSKSRARWVSGRVRDVTGSSSGWAL